MAGTKEIKRRIKSVKNTKKITKAMELVAASKMRRAVGQALSSRLYAGYSWELLTSLSGKLDDVKHVFFDPAGKSTSNGAGGQKTLIVLITSNGSLCGGYNAQAIKKAISLLVKLDPVRSRPLENESATGTSGRPASNGVDIISIGRKGDVAMRRTSQNVLATFTELPAILSLRDVLPISTLITNEFKKGNYKEVHVVYTDFISALTQRPNIRKLLPISKTEFKELIAPTPEGIGVPTSPMESVGKSDTSTPYLIEGDVGVLIESLAEKLVRMQIYQMLLESGASEQSARMVAMKNASEAAGEMIDDLTLIFNKARQAGITQEISEISAGMASVS